MVNKKGNLQLLSHAQDESSGERQIIAPQIHNNRIVGQDEETEKNGGSYFTDSVQIMKSDQNLTKNWLN